MANEKKTTIYSPSELLIKFDAAGKLIGAHVIPWVKDSIGDYNLDPIEGNPIPLRLLDGTINSGASPELQSALSDALSETFTALGIAASASDNKVAELEPALQEAIEAKTKAENEIKMLRDQLDAANQGMADLGEKLAVAKLLGEKDEEMPF